MCDWRSKSMRLERRMYRPLIQNDMRQAYDRLHAQLLKQRKRLKKNMIIVKNNPPASSIWFSISYSNVCFKIKIWYIYHHPAIGPSHTLFNPTGQPTEFCKNRKATQDSGEGSKNPRVDGRSLLMPAQSLLKPVTKEVLRNPSCTLKWAEVSKSQAAERNMTILCQGV